MNQPIRRRRKRTGRFLLPLILIGILCCIATTLYAVVMIPDQVAKLYGSPSSELGGLQKWQYSFRLYQSGEDLLVPHDPDGERTLFEISPSETVQSITGRLVQEGFISSQETFTNYLIYRGQDRCLRSGEYYLSGSMTGIAIAEKLCTSVGDRTVFSILPGWRAEEIANSLASYGFQFNGQEFLEVVNHPDQISDLPASYRTLPSLEGFLFPVSYPLDRDITASEFVRNMVMQFDDAITNKIEKGWTRQGVDPFEAVVLASIVEREAVIDDEKPIIASVFYNRIKAGMRLETDPTVQFALGYNDTLKTWWKVPLSLADLQVNSPYNTYQVDSMPPGPICNPGMDSLRAVAFPADTNYYYFRSACDGSGRHNFSETLDEHLNYACP